MNHNQRVGKYGEAIALRCLKDGGWQLIAKNWRCARGEIDIIARDGQTLVFCEVKTRSSAAYGRPADAINRLKAARLRSLGLQWLTENGGEWHDIRFDVMSVMLPAAGPAVIEHLRGAL